MTLLVQRTPLLTSKISHKVLPNTPKCFMMSPSSGGSGKMPKRPPNISSTPGKEASLPFSSEIDPKHPDSWNPPPKTDVNTWVDTKQPTTMPLTSPSILHVGDKPDIIKNTEQREKEQKDREQETKEQAFTSHSQKADGWYTSTEKSDFSTRRITEEARKPVMVSKNSQQTEEDILRTVDLADIENHQQKPNKATTGNDFSQTLSISTHISSNPPTPQLPSVPIQSLPKSTDEDNLQLSDQTTDSDPTPEKLPLKNTPIYRAITIQETARDSINKPLKKYEAGPNGHVFIAKHDKEKGVLETDVILTSAKKNAVTGDTNFDLGSPNYTGQQKPQRMASVTETRMFKEDQEKKTFEFDPTADAYINDPIMIAKISQGMAQVSSPSTKHKIMRYHENDAELYTEEGYPITEEDTVQREPLPKKEDSADPKDVPNTFQEDVPTADLPDDVD